MLWVAVGLVLIGVVTRDVLRELFRPAGTGTVSRLVRRVVWRGFRRYAGGSPERLRMAGPTMLVCILAVWVVLSVFGWALLYLPYLPEHFRFSSPLVPALETGLGTALYLSLTGLSTVGFGDVTPTVFSLRVAATVQAGFGFMLWTAGISWTLSLKPVLAGQRALASELHGLLEAEVRTGVALDAQPGEVLLPLLGSLAERLSEVRANLLQSPESYYFHADRNESSLAAVLPYLLARTRSMAARHADAAVRFRAVALEHVLTELGRVLEAQYFGGGDEGVEATLRRYAADHLRTPLGV